MIRRAVPTRVWKARLNLLLPTRGLPNVMQRTSAFGYSIAAHAAPGGIVKTFQHQQKLSINPQLKYFISIDAPPQH